MKLDSIKFTEENKDELYKLLRELCLIPAPSHSEQKRAEYCLSWFHKNGCKEAYIDSALNVVFPYNCEGSRDITAFEAHTDTVFPDTEPMPYTDDGVRIYSPGVGDDTACLAVLMLTAKYCVERGLKPKGGILFVANSCEEGLGNLKGTRRIFADYEGRIARFLTLDSHLDTMYDSCVGSHRYKVDIKTQGGHSYSAFGNDSAVNVMAKLIREIYSLSVPEIKGEKTTYNVGIVEGGTSVNTIPEHASMLCEYRSTSAECLAVMKKHFEEIFEAARTDKISVEVTTVGVRPCAENLDMGAQISWRDTLAEVVREVIGAEVGFRSASTDCNIPLSLGIPAVCVGSYLGGGTHTRGEWIERESLITGLEIGLKIAEKLC